MVAALPHVRHIEYPKAGHMGPGVVFAEDACAFLAAEGPAGATIPKESAP
jgi:hypothetical protein